MVFQQAPTILEAAIPECGDAYLAHSMSCAGANNYVYTMLSVWQDAGGGRSDPGRMAASGLSSLLGIDAATA